MLLLSCIELRNTMEDEMETTNAGDSQNFHYFVIVTHVPLAIRHWESGDRMDPLVRHSPSTN
eukprot:6214768-Pleurochrysis_carterae.AAC.9